MTCFAKSLDPSILAAVAFGPKQATPAARTASPTPATSGASGPITTRPMPWLVANDATAAGSAWSISARRASQSMPPLPGAAHSAPARGLSASLRSSACSRPPAPSSRMSTLSSVALMDVPFASMRAGFRPSWDLVPESYFQLRRMVCSRSGPTAMSETCTPLSCSMRSI